MLVTVGQTTNFVMQYEDSFPDAKPRAEALLTTCESDFARLLAMFQVPSSAFGPSNRITSINDHRNGGFNLGYSPTNGAMRVVLDSWPGVMDQSLADDGVRLLFVAEVAEILMDYRRQKAATWNRLASDGEALSLLLGAVFYPGAYYRLGLGPRVNSWFTSPMRDYPQFDFVDANEASDTNPISYGCAMLFIYYLTSQLGFDLGTVIATDGATLEDRYSAITGNTNGYAAFTTLLDRYYPIGQSPKLRTDNPFPLLDASRRSLDISLQISPSGPSTVITTGKVEVRLLGCGPGEYQYSLESTPRQLTCTSEVAGFGLPLFQWRVNGTAVPSSGGTINPTAVVSVDSPANPFHRTISSKPVPINCEISADSFASTLKMTFDGTVGHIDLYVELDASERFASADVTSAISSVTIDNESVQFEPRYYTDVATCLTAFLDQLPRKPPLFLWWRYLPDPPPDFARSFRELEVIVRELRGLFRIAPAEARMITRVLLRDLSIGDATLGGILERSLELEGDGQ